MTKHSSMLLPEYQALKFQVDYDRQNYGVPVIISLFMFRKNFSCVYDTRTVIQKSDSKTINRAVDSLAQKRSRKKRNRVILQRNYTDFALQEQ